MDTIDGIFVVIKRLKFGVISLSFLIKYVFHKHTFCINNGHYRGIYDRVASPAGEQVRRSLMGRKCFVFQPDLLKMTDKEDIITSSACA